MSGTGKTGERHSERGTHVFGKELNDDVEMSTMLLRAIVKMLRPARGKKGSGGSAEQLARAVCVV